MDVKEKLVELLGRVQQMGVIYRENQMDERYPAIEQIRNTEVAACLITNGVTVQEWVSVKDRLPEPKENAICLNRHGDMMIGTYTEWGWMFPCYFEGPTHWMPLPHPLKGE